MPRSPLLLSLILALICSAALARGVLLPDDGTDGTSLPNLGLMPTDEDAEPIINDRSAYHKTPSAQTNPAATQENDEESLSAIAAQGKDNFIPIPSTVTPGGVLAMDKNAAIAEDLMAKKIASGHLPQTRGQNRVAEMARKIAQEKEKQLAEDPLILDELPILEPDPDMFPNKIVAAVVGTYQWGENDILAIKRDLGYGASEITSNCQLRLEIIVKAKNKTSSPKGVLLAGTRAELRYESDVGGISLFPSALCFPPKTPLPRRGGLIKRSGANLAIHLPGIAQCKYEAAFPPQSVQIQYLGDGKANCQFK